jgi:hypothetical protein
MSGISSKLPTSTKVTVPSNSLTSANPKVIGIAMPKTGFSPNSSFQLTPASAPAAKLITIDMSPPKPAVQAAAVTATQVQSSRPGENRNATLAAAMDAVDPANHYLPKGNTTYCNLAFAAYAQQLGNTELKGMNAATMFKHMSDPANGWKVVDAQGAIDAAAGGKLVAAGWDGSKKYHGHGHVAGVQGSYSEGVPGIGQAGSHNFNWAPITKSRPETPTYFVKE